MIIEFTDKEKKLLTFLVAKDMTTLLRRAKDIKKYEEWESDYRKLIAKINKQ
jgi:hypothetical protein